MNYIIQTRNSTSDDAFNPTKMIARREGSESEWVNQNSPFATLDKAAEEAQSLIENGKHSASDVRVVKNVMVFKSKTVVEQYLPDA